MNPASWPWLGVTLLLPLAGAATVAFVRPPARAARVALAFLLAALAAAIGTVAAFLASGAPGGFAGGVFRADDLAAPMLPVLGVLHLLALLGTSKSRWAPGFCVRMLLSAAITPAAVTCQHAAGLAALMTFLAFLPAWDLASRGRPARAYWIHLLPFAGLLLAAGIAWGNPSAAWAPVALLIALRLLGGTVPFHGWLPSLFQKAGFATAMLLVLPLVDIAAALRFVLPHAPERLLDAAALACLVTAVYSAGMAVVQEEVRRFYAFLALSQTSMVAFAVMAHTPTSITAALCLWFSLVPALAGLGLSVRALEARFGPLSLREHHGYYDQVPGLAVGFLVAGLASVGFPGTIGFVPMELLVSGSAQKGLGTSVTLALAALLNGIAILRAYFSLFTGRRPTPSVSLRMTAAERTGIVLLVLLVFLAGWFSPSVVASRHRVADRLLESRAANTGAPPRPAPSH
jgi:NADH-quinone oxidoreductase subunit M